MLNPSNHEHAALLYANKEELDMAISQYLNEGLSRGQLCVYATIRYRDEGHLENFSSMIKNYKENVDNKNLLVVDLAPLYISALIGDMKPFKDAGALFSEMAKGRPDEHVRFVGDGTGFLFKNKHFDECALVEEWWQSKPFEGSYVCPYPKQFFGVFPHDMHAKRAVIDKHDIVVNASGEKLLGKGTGVLESTDQQQQLPSSEVMQGYNSKMNPLDNGGTGV